MVDFGRLLGLACWKVVPAVIEAQLTLPPLGSGMRSPQCRAQVRSREPRPSLQMCMVSVYRQLLLECNRVFTPIVITFLEYDRIERRRMSLLRGWKAFYGKGRTGRARSSACSVPNPPHTRSYTLRCGGKA
jgi:hypothetical protein